MYYVKRSVVNTARPSNFLTKLLYIPVVQPSVFSQISFSLGGPKAKKKTRSAGQIRTGAAHLAFRISWIYDE